MVQAMSYGLIKTSEGYINPNSIAAIQRVNDNKSKVFMNNKLDKDFSNDYEDSSMFYVWANPDKLAEAAVEAMTTGNIIDLTA